MRGVRWCVVAISLLGAGSVFAHGGAQAGQGTTSQRQSACVRALERKARCEARRAEQANRELKETQSELRRLQGQQAQAQAAQPREEILVQTTVFYPLGGDTLTPEAQEQLDRIVVALKEAPDTTVRVVGNTDSTGTPQLNEQLSFNRAQAVKQWFVNQGVDPSRITVEGRGENAPIARNNTSSGRATNRRSEIAVLPGTAMGGAGQAGQSGQRDP